MATASLNGSAKKADPRPMDVPFAKINMEYESTQMRPERDPEREEMFRELYAEGAEVDRVDEDVRPDRRRIYRHPRPDLPREDRRGRPARGRQGEQQGHEAPVPDDDPQFGLYHL
jgi:hypothetical protein